MAVVGWVGIHVLGRYGLYRWSGFYAAPCRAIVVCHFERWEVGALACPSQTVAVMIAETCLLKEEKQMLDSTRPHCGQSTSMTKMMVS